MDPDLRPSGGAAVNAIRVEGVIAELQRHGLSYVEAQAWLLEHAAEVEAAHTPKRDTVQAVRAVCRQKGMRRR